MMMLSRQFSSLSHRRSRIAATLVDKIKRLAPLYYFHARPALSLLLSYSPGREKKKKTDGP